MKLLSRFIALCLFLALSLTGCQDKQSIPFEAGPDQGPGLAGAGANRWIVVFEPGTFVNEPARDALIKKFGESLKEIELVNGVVVYLPPQAVAALGKEVGVVRVDPDVVVHINSEDVPWGVDRIDAEPVLNLPSTGAGIKVAILDTGIDLDHPDLVANIAGEVNIIRSNRTGDDDNGHGTHVAGTVAAVDNDIGVVGVAPGASLYAVKVLDRRGSGFLSDVIAGIQWCMANDIDVINMSLSADVDVQSFRDAITAAASVGITLVAAAGNDAGTVDYPAAYDETIAVSATDANDAFASFSNYGPEIELAAPGVAIPSTYRGGGYRVLSGTSMSAPHVTGTVALVLAVGGSPDDVINNAEDLGFSSDQQGSGLVDAAAAVGAPTPPPNEPPTVSIASPADGSTFDSGAEISFAGTASDPEDGALTASLIWTSDKDGQIGTGGSFSTTLSDGTHEITAEVTDGGGKTGSASITITVGGVSPPPGEVTVTGIDPSTIDAPVYEKTVTITGTGFVAGASVTFLNSFGDPPTVSDVVVVNDYTITAKVDAEALGPPRKKTRVWDVRVANLDGSSGVLVDGFTVTP